MARLEGRQIVALRMYARAKGRTTAPAPKTRHPATVLRLQSELTDTTSVTNEGTEIKRDEGLGSGDREQRWRLRSTVGWGAGRDFFSRNTDDRPLHA